MRFPLSLNPAGGRRARTGLLTLCVAGFALSVGAASWPPEEDAAQEEPDTRSETCLRELQEARRLAGKRDLTGALVAALRARQADPQSQDARWEEALALASLSRIDESLAAAGGLVETALARHPDLLRRTEARAAAHNMEMSRTLGEPAAAAEWASKLLFLDPENRHGFAGQAWAALGAAAKARNDPSSAFVAERFQEFSQWDAGRGREDDNRDFARLPSVWRDEFVVLREPAGKAAPPPPQSTWKTPTLEENVGTSCPLQGQVGVLVPHDSDGVAVFSDASAAMAVWSPDAGWTKLTPDTGGPVGAAAAFTNTWWVAPAGTPRLLEMDFTGRILREIPMPQAVDSLAVCPASGQAFAACRHRLVRVDLASGEATATHIPADVVRCDSARRTVHTLAGPGAFPSGDQRPSEPVGRVLWEMEHRARLEFQSVLFQCRYDDLGRFALVSFRLRAGQKAEDVSVSADGNWIAVAGGLVSSGTAQTSAARVWQRATLRPLEPLLEGNGVRTVAVAFHPATRLLALGGGGGLALKEAGNPPGLRVDLPGSADRLVWAAGCRRLFAVDQGRLRVFSGPADSAVAPPPAAGAADVAAVMTRRKEGALRRVAPLPAVDWLAAFAPATSLDEAKAAATKAAEAVPQNAPDRLRPPRWDQTELYGDTRSDPARSLMDLLSGEREYEPAVALFRLRALYGPTPASAPARLALGLFLAESGEHEAAAGHLLEALRLDAGRTSLSAEALIRLAMLHSLKGREAEALSCAAAALRLDPREPRLLVLSYSLFRHHELAPLPHRGPGLEQANVPPSPPPPELRRPEHPADGTRLDAVEIYRQLVPATLVVKSEHGSGSAVFITADGYALTNFHVVDPPDKPLEVQLFQVRDNDLVKIGTRAARTVFWDAASDVALIRVDDPPYGINPVPIARQDPPAGTTVFALGSPGFWGTVLSQSLTEGLVSATRRVLDDGFVALQHSAALNRGNSGGPLVNTAGELVGLNARKSWLENTGFAVSAERLRKILKIE